MVENLSKLDKAFHISLDDCKQQLREGIMNDSKAKDNGLEILKDKCYLLSQLKSYHAFINDKVQGVNWDVLAIKKSMLERKDKLIDLRS